MNGGSVHRRRGGWILTFQYTPTVAGPVALEGRPELDIQEGGVRCRSFRPLRLRQDDVPCGALALAALDNTATGRHAHRSTLA